MSAFDEATVDQKILDRLNRAPAPAWAALWEALDALAGETTFAAWEGGVVNAAGEEQAVHSLPYPNYTEPVERLRSCLGALGLTVPFDWMNWEGVARYRDAPALLTNAPVTDAVRLLIAIQRSERFSDGNIEGALISGVMQAALARLRHWCDTRPH